MLIDSLILASLIVSLVLLVNWGNHYINDDNTTEIKKSSLTNKLAVGFVGVSIASSMVLLAYTEFANIEPDDVVGVVDRYKIVRYYSNAVRVVVGKGECSTT